MNHFLLAGLLAPIWFPLLRLAISFFQSSRPAKATIWWYAITLLWTTGWIAFQWAIKIPSGIGYGLALISGWFIMLAAIATEGITAATSGDRTRKEIASTKFSWTLILIVGVVIGALWLRHEYRQHNLKHDIEIEEKLAKDFVKNNNIVIQRVGHSFEPSLSTASVSNEGRRVRYEFLVGSLYAIVSVSRLSGTPEFTLDCITPLVWVSRDVTKDACKQ